MFDNEPEIVVYIYIIKLHSKGFMKKKLEKT